MRVLETIIDHMDDTLEEAHEYYRDYVIFKDDYPDVANTALTMSREHLNLYIDWHDLAKKMIEQKKAEGKYIPPGMLENWAYFHRKFSEEYNDLRKLVG